MSLSPDNAFSGVAGITARKVGGRAAGSRDIEVGRKRRRCLCHETPRTQEKVAVMRANAASRGSKRRRCLFCKC